MQVAMEVEGDTKGFKYWIFENGLLQDILFIHKMRKSEAHTMYELMNMAQSFINLEEKLNTQFNNSVAAESNSGLLTRNESHRWKDEFDQGVHGRYEKPHI